MSRAFVTYGGWVGHDPAGCAGWCAELLRSQGFEVDVAESLEPLTDESFLTGLDLIVPVWSLAKAPNAKLDAFVAAVGSGIGLASFHGAAATFDAHRGYHHMIGGSFVWHPEEREYTVHPRWGRSFNVFTEQYHLHVDPSNEIVASTRLETGTSMPVAWKRTHGLGRVFYMSLGHSQPVLEITAVTELFARGVAWASRTESV